MIAIEHAHVDNAPVMHALQQQAFAEEGRRSGTTAIPPLTESVAAIEEHIRTQIAFVARDDGRIVGAVRGVVTDGVCMIRALVVDPACQGRSIGSTLLRALEAALPEVTRFELTTNMLMENNVPFYERHGYRVYETVQHNERIRLAQMAKDVAVSG